MKFLGVVRIFDVVINIVLRNITFSSNRIIFQFIVAVMAVQFHPRLLVIGFDRSVYIFYVVINILWKNTFLISKRIIFQFTF